MAISIIFFIISLILFSRAFNSLTLALLISSLLLSLTPLSDSNLQIPLIIVSILLGLINKTFLLIRNRFLIFLFIITISLFILPFSFDFNPINTLGKIAKIIAISLPIALRVNTENINPNYNSVFQSFIILCICGITFWFTPNKLDSGFMGSYRLASISSDPNYSAIVLISVLFISKLLNIKMNKKQLLSFFILIALTQSVSSILVGIVIYFFCRVILRHYNLSFFFLFLIVSFYIALIFYASNNNTFSANDGWQENYVAMKLNSLYFRMRAQFMGAEMLSLDPFRLFYGYGSGKSLIFFDRVMHNSYMQILFDHGIIFLIIIMFYFNFLIKNSLLYIVFLYLQLMSFMFDSYFMGILSFTYVLFYSLYLPNKKSADHV